MTYRHTIYKTRWGAYRIIYNDELGREYSTRDIETKELAKNQLDRMLRENAIEKHVAELNAIRPRKEVQENDEGKGIEERYADLIKHQQDERL